MIPSVVFVPAVALQTKYHSPANFWEMLGICQRRPLMLCWPRKRIQPGSSWKALGSVVGVRQSRRHAGGVGELSPSNKAPRPPYWNL